MPIKVILAHEVILPDIWGTKEEVANITLQAWKDVLAEDFLGFLEGVGGIDGLVVGVEWVDLEEANAS